MDERKTAFRMKSPQRVPPCCKGQPVSTFAPVSVRSISNIIFAYRFVSGHKESDFFKRRMKTVTTCLHPFDPVVSGLTLS